MFCALKDLLTESDVEQKLLWPLLTSSAPTGAGLLSADVLTKLSIRRLEIGKGTSKKLYYPDYMVVLAGLPVLVLEAKAPREPLGQALNEARLYGNELNALFPTGINPCIRVIASNGHELLTSPLDTSEPDLTLRFEDISIGSTLYADLIDKCQRATLQKHADEIRRRFRKLHYRRAASQIGGASFQNEELAPNTFGSTIVGDYGHIFNAKSREDREVIARKAYVPSLRRQRYVEPIDRLVRAAVMPTTTRIPALENTAEPTELNAAFAERRNLENQILLLVGSVGSGKSTFIDYVSLVALSPELRARSIWARINLNDAPLSTELAYGWISDALVNELQREIPEEDIHDLGTIEKVFRAELAQIKRGPISLLAPDSMEYKTRLADALLKLQQDPTTSAKCLARYVCSGPGKLLVIVLDNCDKRTRDEQLTMFQIAQWVRTQFRALVVLPLRDVTFDRHRHEPPLDTAIKDLTFRIEPPPFIEVLQSRVRLALEEMERASKNAPTLSYVLPNGVRVSYPAADQSLYLASILRSLFAHDRFVRRVMTGLAGRDVRRALEIFLDFCMSGHIGEDEIYKIRFFEGKHVLPLSLVARVLLRMRRRYYDGDQAYIKNLIQCDPKDALPDNFVRLAILHWLEHRQSQVGPAGVPGFHKIEALLRDLVQLGHDAQRVREDVLYLSRHGCIIPEHQRLDTLVDGDLIKITASGLVHLQLMANPEYLAACAEDTYIADADFVARVADRITRKGISGQFSRTTAAKNAWELVAYLKKEAEGKLAAPDIYIDSGDAEELKILREAEAAVGATEIEVPRRLYVGNLVPDTSAADLRSVFERAGLAVANVVSAPRPSNHPFRWYAFVEMADGKSALEAVDSRELNLKGRRLVIDEAHPLSSQVEQPRDSRNPCVDVTERLHISGLPYASTEDSVRILFQNHDLHPVEIYLPRDRQTGRGKGYGFVSFGSASEAARAIGAVNEMVLEGRSLLVKPASPRRPA